MSGFGKMSAVWSTLRARDPHNQTLAVTLLLLLSQVKQYKQLRLLRAYTFWNITGCLTNFAFRLGWEAPLFCNSMSIFACYRTASYDSHHLFVTRSLLPEPLYMLGDAIVHFVPVLSLFYYLTVRKPKYIRPQIGAFSLLAQAYFAYSQVGQLNVEDLYVPHDVFWSWVASILAHIFAPNVINNAIRKRYHRVVGYLLIIFLPLLLKATKTISWTKPERKEVPCEQCSEKLCQDCFDVLVQ